MNTRISTFSQTWPTMWEPVTYENPIFRYVLLLTDSEYGYLVTNSAYWAFLFDKIKAWGASQCLTEGIDYILSIGGAAIRFEKLSDRTAFLMSFNEPNENT